MQLRWLRNKKKNYAHESLFNLNPYFLTKRDLLSYSPHTHTHSLSLFLFKPCYFIQITRKSI
ncbi:uncharacterized protein B0P05DRAFT_531485 [Gilbertella persicaria]|uniref:uncharacterized protein n=1 Tax=Gilbertella persicaria TaxID=101096 RepID=UPI00222109CD|nr:uncharacterized protein B0P05DRAFT_531485 [Gilbertella persicaria]KAI8087576.1 hypothetical protein B0P05DRAFT_531485 [Gilbertella persicaria]